MRDEVEMSFFVQNFVKRLISVFALVGFFLFVSFENALASDEAAISGGSVSAVNDGAPKGNFKKFDSRFMGRPEQKSAEEKLRDVADMYEKHFLREMMKSMRTTVSPSGLIKQNQAEKIFQEQLDDKNVDSWGDRGGIGLSNLIYNQLIEKFGERMGIKMPVAKPQGPLPLDEKSSFTARTFQHPGKRQSMSYRIDRRNTTGKVLQQDNSIKAPWDGTLGEIKTMADSQTMVKVEHDNGLKSQLVFTGEVSKLSTGQKLQAGDTLGFLAPDAKSMYWTVESSEGPGPQTVLE